MTSPATRPGQLMTPSLGALSLATLAFFVAGGIFLPAVPRSTFVICAVIALVGAAALLIRRPDQAVPAAA